MDKLNKKKARELGRKLVPKSLPGERYVR